MDNTLVAEIILGIIILIIIAGHFFYVRETNKEKSKLINALISKNAEELQNLEYNDKVKPPKNESPKPPDMVPVTELTDKEFMENVIGKEDINGSK